VTDLDEFIDQKCREIAAQLMPCWVCGSTAVTHECPPNNKLLGLAAFIEGGNE
jgi:hypothetical protein